MSGVDKTKQKPAPKPCDLCGAPSLPGWKRCKACSDKKLGWKDPPRGLTPPRVETVVQATPPEFPCKPLVTKALKEQGK